MVYKLKDDGTVVARRYFINTHNILQRNAVYTVAAAVRKRYIIKTIW